MKVRNLEGRWGKVRKAKVGKERVRGKALTKKKRKKGAKAPKYYFFPISAQAGGIYTVVLHAVFFTLSRFCDSVYRKLFKMLPPPPTLRQGVTLSFRSKCHGTSAMTVLDTIPGESSGAHQWGYVFDIIKHISDT